MSSRTSGSTSGGASGAEGPAPTQLRRAGGKQSARRVEAFRRRLVRVRQGTVTLAGRQKEARGPCPRTPWRQSLRAAVALSVRRTLPDARRDVARTLFALTEGSDGPSVAGYVRRATWCDGTHMLLRRRTAARTDAEEPDE
jgi:hypothetical protein